MAKFLVALCICLPSTCVFADLVAQNPEASNDRLGDLAKAVQGSYEAPKLNANVRNQGIVISNDYMANKYRKAPTVSSLKSQTEPKIGMTQNQVINNTYWNNPTSRHSTETRNGIYEIWYYGNIASLTFRNGRVESISRYSR